MAPDMPHQFLGDETRLRQILMNLIGNAVKFTEQGGVSVWLGTEELDGGRELIRIAIRDSGPGLTAEACTRVFDEFERAVPAGALHESGTGLGLAIAQRLARSMGGAITVSSKPGVGATFTLTVCLPRMDQALGTAHSAGTVPRSFSGRHVAIVSSDQIERRTIADFLRAHHIAVSEARDITELEQLAAGDAGSLDTVLLDYTVDPQVASSILERIADDVPPRAAVMATTGNRSEFERFSACGIDSFLIRPIRPKTLLALLAGEVAKPEFAPTDECEVMQQNPDVPAVSDHNLAWRVLVAEDNEINALLTRTVLTRLGCEPIVVPNGREAIEAVERSLIHGAPHLDAILMDLHMPVVDGFEATREIRRICEAANVPVPAVIAVTANAFQEDRERCLAAGMLDYLSKPFEPGDLKRVLDGIAARRLTGS